jgi:hypothetical protein
MSKTQKFFAVMQGMNNEIAMKSKIMANQMDKGHPPTDDAIHHLEEEAQEFDTMLDVFELLMTKKIVPV